MKKLLKKKEPRGLLLLLAYLSADKPRNKRLDVALHLAEVDVAHGNQDSRLLNSAKLVVDGRSEHLHRGRKVHVRVDERRNVLAQLADSLLKDLVALLVGFTLKQGVKHLLIQL